MEHVDAAGEPLRGADQVKLKKEITLLNGVTIIVGSIVGSGIFVSPKGVVEHVSSVGVSLVIWSLCGVFSLFGATCYAELGTCIPRSGGDFAYILEAFGPLPAFLQLWVSVLIIHPVSLAVVALTFAHYIVEPFYQNCEPPDAAVRLLAAMCLCTLTFVNCQSVKWAMKVQDYFTYAKLAALFTIIIMGFIYIIRGHRHYYEDAFKGDFTVEGLSLSFYSGLFAYAGWNYLNFATEELKSPHKNLPRAIWIGIPIVTVVYVFANVAYFSVVSIPEMMASPAVAVTFAMHTFGLFAWAMPIFVALSTFGGINGMLFASSRLICVAAQEGHIPKILGMIHITKRTPTPSLLLLCFLSLIMLSTSDIFLLINYLSFAHWLFIGIATLGLLVLRWKRPEMNRPIRVNLIFPISFLLCCIFLTAVPLYAKPKETAIGLVIILTGIPVYLLSSRYSRLGRNPSDAIVKLISSLQKLLCVVMPEYQKLS